MVSPTFSVTMPRTMDKSPAPQTPAIGRYRNNRQAERSVERGKARPECRRFTDRHPRAFRDR